MNPLHEELHNKMNIEHNHTLNILHFSFLMVEAKKRK